MRSREPSPENQTKIGSPFTFMFEQDNTGAEGSTDTPLDSAVQGSLTAPDESASTIGATETSASALDSDQGAAGVEDAPEEQQLNEFQLETELDQFENDLDAALAAENAEIPPYSRNALKQYKKYVSQFREQLAPFRDLRGVVSDDQLPETLEMLRALHNVRMINGRPQPDAARFTEIFEQRHGDLIPELIKQWGQKTSPGSNTSHLASVLKEQYGIGPEHIEAVKSYLESNTPVEIPPEYAEAYRQLSPTLKNEFEMMGAEAQVELLRERQERIDRAAQDQKAQTEQAQQMRMEIEQGAEARYLKTTGTAMESFVSTLAKAQFSADPQENDLIIEQNLQLVLNALNPYSVGHERAKSVVSKLGVQLDESRINGILDVIAEESRNIEYFQRIGDADGVRQSEAKSARALQELTAQGHKVAGHIMRARGQGVANRADVQNAMLERTEARPVINGRVAGAAGASQDWMKDLGVPGTSEYRERVAQLAAGRS